MTVTANKGVCAAIADRVKTNFHNMSGLKKFGLAVATIALVGSSIAAFTCTPCLVAFSATTLGFAVSALAVQLTAGGVGAAGLGLAAYSLLGAPKKKNESEVELPAVPTAQAQEEAQGPEVEPAATVVAEEAPAQPSFSLRNFAYNHRYKLLGAVLVTAAVVGAVAYLGKDGIQAQGQNLVGAGKQAFAKVAAKLPTFKN